MPAGRHANEHEDTTELNGPGIDVAVRVGWLMRTARLLYGGDALRRVEDMRAAIGGPLSRVQRLEAGKLRNADVVLKVEDALDMPAGQLLAPIEVLCRTFPEVAPAERAGVDEPTGPDALSGMTEQLLDDDIPATGGDWLLWSRAMAEHGGIGLPRSLASRLVRRLMGELSRSAARGYVTRYEALALLRSGGYGPLVLDLGRSWVADPHAQAIGDLVSAVAERHSPEAVAWLLELLEGDRDRLVVAGAIGLESIAAVSRDPDFWPQLLPSLVEIYNLSAPGSPRAEWIEHVLKLVPSAVWPTSGVRLRRPLPRAAVVRSPSAARTNTLWNESRARADRVAARVGLQSDKLLARLVYDVAFSPRETHAVTTWMLLGGLPDLSHEVGCELAALAEDHPDPALRSRILRRIPGLFPATIPPDLDEWLTSGDEDLRESALYIAGPAGVHVPVEVLREEARASGFPSAAMNCAGMAGHPVLGEWLTHERDDVRGAARWWLRRGARVVA